MTPYYQDDLVTIYHGSWEMFGDAAGSGVIVTDPPYGTGGWRRPAGGAGSDPSAGLVIEAWDDGAVDWLYELADWPVITFWPAARTL